MVLLIGNYAPDQQESMQRFASMMLHGLHAAGVPAELIQPEPVWASGRSSDASWEKLVGYAAKFLLFPRRLRRKLAESPALLHICDHSNAMYASAAGRIPVVVTCHDLLAVRSALGESTDCRVSFTGRYLQGWIRRALSRANAIACVSEATRNDLQRLLTRGKPTARVITLGLSYGYQKLAVDETTRRLAAIPAFDPAIPFVLHVGSNLVRKNRAGVLRIFARMKDSWNGRLVFAGIPLSAELHALAEELGISERIVEVRRPPNELLEALYNRATALLFPSTFEGFGWPIAEAQACGCPIVCSDIAPFQEVTAGSALMRSVRDEDTLAADLLSLNQPAERERWSEKSLHNAERFSAARMISEYVQLYRTLVPQL